MPKSNFEFRPIDKMGKPAADIPAAVVVLGERGLLDAEHAKAAARGLLRTRETEPNAEIILSVMGYGHELWDMQEVRDYMLLVFDAVFDDWHDGSLGDLNLEPFCEVMVLDCALMPQLTPIPARRIFRQSRYELWSGRGKGRQV